jgi:protein adenylyltransferase
VLATAMLEALGVPTSKSFALVETGEHLQRNDEPSPTRAAVLTRLSHSHIRFGTFQRQAYFDKPDEIRSLVDYAVELYYPQLGNAPDKPVALFGAVLTRSAELVGGWMAAGFVHGVLNTDNMNLTGESFDYGPYRFLPKNDPNFVAAYFDENGLYAFGRQAETVFWNLRQLAGALTLVAEADPLVETLNTFSAAYRAALGASMLRRLGLTPRSPDEDIDLVNAAFKALAEGGEALRWEPFFFDWFGGLASERRALAGRRGHLYGGEDFAVFRERLKPYEMDRPVRLASAYFAAAEPEELLYDEIEQLWAAIAERDDWAPFEAKLARIETARLAWDYRQPET